jgi:hypothetical protein
MDIPRVISCADETKEYLCLPRGCESELVSELEELGIEIRLIDKTHKGRKIDVEFNGQLRDEQSLALNTYCKTIPEYFQAQQHLVKQLWRLS